MARRFTGSAGVFLRNLTGSPVSGPPLTIATLFNPASTHKGILAGLFDSNGGGSNQDRMELFANSDGTVAWQNTGSVGFGAASTSTTYSLDTWQHACGVEISASSRAVYLNGAGKGTNTSSVTLGNYDTVGVGRRTIASGFPFNGDLGHIAMWNVALSDGQVASLAAGLNPKQMLPGNLVFYAPLNGQSPEIDIVGRLDLELVGSPAVVEEPPIMRRAMVAPG